MNRWFFFVLSLIILIGLPMDLEPAKKVNRVALVIGNNSYGKYSLRNCLNDARDMRAALGKLGFYIMAGGDDVDKFTMERLIRGLGKKLESGGVGLFYYAGHAVEFQGVNYLLPIGSEIDTRNEAELNVKAVNATVVIGELERAANDLNILILDACRLDPSRRSYGWYSRGVEKLVPPEKSKFGSVIIYATAPGKFANDGIGRNGVFTKHLLKHIRTPGLKIEDMLKRVAMGVESDTRGEQEPWNESNLKTDFYFDMSVPPGKISSLPPELLAGNCDDLMDIWPLPEIEQKTGEPPFPTMTVFAEANATLYSEACKLGITRAACMFFGRQPSNKEFKQAVHRMYCDRLGEMPGDKIRVRVQIEFYKKYQRLKEG